MEKLPYDRQVAMEVLFTGHGPDTFKGIIHNLSRSKLPKLILENAEMPRVILDESDLKKARLRGSNLQGARFVLADLHEADLSRADLRHCKLNNANLINADLRGADLRGADLTLTKLQGAKLGGVKLDEDELEQLAYAKSLYGARGLTSETKAELDKRNPSLFWKPENQEDDPYRFQRS